MFVHIGNDYVLQSKNIISIIDRNLIQSSSIIKEMMDTAKERKQIKGAKKDAKSVVITDDFFYYSTLSVPTLKKRSNTILTLSTPDYYD
ncbi:extracellular matrix regulator RemB [Virgibacillus sp. W0181]|uniref:extracellular matrix regulator RemB n=1 Tax=Virgibacillus sp. W0181 TaxID=3391581 RepID=UPI003F48001D